jgi:hypothetical protein
MHLRSWAESTTKGVVGAIRQIGLRVLKSELLTHCGLPICALLVLCLRHAVASISV